MAEVRHTVCWVDIPASDLDRALSCYSAMLGVKVTKQSSHGHEFGLLPHVDNNVSGCIVAGPDHHPSENGPLVYLNVNGRLEQAIAAGLKNGATLVQAKHPIGPYGYRAILRDSEGNRIALHSASE